MDRLGDEGVGQARAMAGGCIPCTSRGSWVSLMNYYWAGQFPEMVVPRLSGCLKYDRKMLYEVPTEAAP